MAQFDVVVIGAGPGGYIAAIRAAQLGFKVACIDAGKNKKGDAPALGGTCLNVGCIPSKALLQSSEEFAKVSTHLDVHGIKSTGVTIDIDRMIARKDKIVSQLTGGVAFLFKKNKITSLYGQAAFVGKKDDFYELEVTNDKEKNNLTARHVIIASGSRPRSLPGITIDNINILDNVGALNLTAVPKKLAMIGAGVIGLEMSSVWQRLGAQVTVLEAMPQFLPMADGQIAREALRILTKEQNLNIKLGAAVTKVIAKNKGVTVGYTHDGTEREETFDKLIIAVGRAPYTENLNLKAVGIATDAKGFIAVDADCRTRAANIWAIGDVVRGPMLAHKASEEGVAVAERIGGQKPQVNLDIMPAIVYTAPEIAWVGKTEEQLKSEGIAYKKGTTSFAANGRALALGAAQGTVKILTDAETDRILGVHMLGPMVSELITEAVMALEFSAAGEDIARMVHAHPTLAEAIHEAALAVDKRALNG